ncbi:MAG: Smr/MutS family protein [Altererythrobacter sp.]|nr:Smr/MutS family protein [Altererythrobacter sp.]
MSAPRGLSREEAALWRRVAATVRPLAGRALPPPDESKQPPEPAPTPAKRLSTPAPRRAAGVPPPPPKALDRSSLDSTWDRKLARGDLSPDFVLDLHGHTLDQAHARLGAGLGQATAMGARVVLLVTGKPRPAEAADRGSRRGAIRAKVLDWLAAGPHGPDIAAIRKAHPRHGGEGALYLVLKRRR